MNKLNLAALILAFVTTQTYANMHISISNYTPDNAKLEVIDEYGSHLDDETTNQRICLGCSETIASSSTHRYSITHSQGITDLTFELFYTEAGKAETCVVPIQPSDVGLMHQKNCPYVHFSGNNLYIEPIS